MWEDNIRMDLREIGWGGTDWIDLTQDRDQWRAFVMNLWVSYNIGKLLSSCATGGFSRTAQLHGVSCVRDRYRKHKKPLSLPTAVAGTVLRSDEGRQCDRIQNASSDTKFARYVELHKTKQFCLFIIK
jgi:hypothetical protein